MVTGTDGVRLERVLSPLMAFAPPRPPPLSRLGVGRIGARAQVDSETAVSAWRKSRLRRSPLPGETRRRSACFAGGGSITCWRMTPSCWLVGSATVFATASMGFIGLVGYWTLSDAALAGVSRRRNRRGALRPGLDLRRCAALSRCCTHGARRVRVSVPGKMESYTVSPSAAN